MAFYPFIHYFIISFLSSITAPQDAHKLVLQVAEWLTASLSGLARHELTTYSLVQALKYE